MARRIAQSAYDACRASICHHVHALAFLGPKAQFDGAQQLTQADPAGGLYRGNLHTNWQTVPYAEGRAKGVWSSGLFLLVMASTHFSGLRVDDRADEEDEHHNTQPTSCWAHIQE